MGTDDVEMQGQVFDCELPNAHVARRALVWGVSLGALPQAHEQTVVDQPALP